MAAEGDLRRSTDLAQLCFGVVGNRGTGLLNKRVHRLLRAAAHEIRKCLDVLRLLSVQPGGEAPGKIPWITMSGMLLIALAMVCQPCTTDCM